jgi:hypothetical protein
MGKLECFIDLKSKNGHFDLNPNLTEYYTIKKTDVFDKWFNEYVNLKTANRTNFIFRGMKEAQHRLYTSAQRIWIENDMAEWPGNSYINFIKELSAKAKENALLKRVFEVYKYYGDDRDFPALSILQHYGAPTPFMDWTYNINVALFFATENSKPGHGTDDIDDYFSIYFLNKGVFVDGDERFINILTKASTNKAWAQLQDFDNHQDNNPQMLYLSDFEDPDIKKHHDSIAIRTKVPLTSIYNQNIIPQEGLFIFNPSAKNPIDEMFLNMAAPIVCFNIKKDLADYVRRKIQHNAIETGFIYPELKRTVPNILNEVLNKLVTLSPQPNTIPPPEVVNP